MPKCDRAIIVGDTHVPYHSEEALEAVFKFTKDFRPNAFIYLGDLLDFEALSRFLKDPRKTADPQEEIDEGKKLLSRFARALPSSCDKVFLYGNHEERLEKYLMRNAPAVLSLRSLNLYELLGLDGWRVVPPDQFYKRGDLVVVHGVSYGPTTNQKNIARFGGFNVAQGHSHRLSQTFVKSLHGIHSAAQIGCTCDLEPHYTHHPDWAHGFATYNGALAIHLINDGKVMT